MCVWHVQSCKVVQVSGIHGHTHASSRVAVLLCTSLYSTVQSTGVQSLYFKPRMSRSKHKSSGDATCTPKERQLLNYTTTVLFKVLFCKLKNILSFVLVFMYYLCDKYYKPITEQYCIADHIRWVPRLTLWTYKQVKT